MTLLYSAAKIYSIVCDVRLFDELFCRYRFGVWSSGGGSMINKPTAWIFIDIAAKQNHHRARTATIPASLKPQLRPRRLLRQSCCCHVLRSGPRFDGAELRRFTLPF